MKRYLVLILTVVALGGCSQNPSDSRDTTTNQPGSSTATNQGGPGTQVGTNSGSVNSATTNATSAGSSR